MDSRQKISGMTTFPKNLNFTDLANKIIKHKGMTNISAKLISASTTKLLGLAEKIIFYGVRHQLMAFWGPVFIFFKIKQGWDS